MWARNGRWILPEMPDFQVAFRNFLHAVNLRHGIDGFTSPPKEGVLRIFSAGFEPANLGTKGQHVTSRPPKPLSVPLVIQHGKRMRLIVLSSVAYPALPYFSTLSHKRFNFRKNILNLKFEFWFSLQILSETFLILRRNEWDIIITVLKFSHNFPIILVRFLPCKDETGCVGFEDPGLTGQKTLSASVIKTDKLIMRKEFIVIFFLNP